MQFFDFFNIFDFMGPLFLFMFIVPLIFVVVVIIVFVKVCRSSNAFTGGLVIEPPTFVIPESHQGRRRSDGTEIKTVRLPPKCPACGAAVSQEGIDWVGPLEAKCNYCGGTVRASFESI
ncbi:MAG: hypothetical protein KAR33_03570 [Candidatus Thorarchaeota archaeon]|nr:hypothetical protein [Candidatus Thorarchaeota archaeon]